MFDNVFLKSFSCLVLPSIHCNNLTKRIGDRYQSFSCNITKHVDAGESVDCSMVAWELATENSVLMSSAERYKDPSGERDILETTCIVSFCLSLSVHGSAES